VRGKMLESMEGLCLPSYGTRCISRTSKRILRGKRGGGGSGRVRKGGGRSARFLRCGCRRTRPIRRPADTNGRVKSERVVDRGGVVTAMVGIAGTLRALNLEERESDRRLPVLGRLRTHTRGARVCEAGCGFWEEVWRGRRVALRSCSRAHLQDEVVEGLRELGVGAVVGIFDWKRQAGRRSVRWGGVDPGVPGGEAGVERRLRHLAHPESGRSARGAPRSSSASPARPGRRKSRRGSTERPPLRAQMSWVEGRRQNQSWFTPVSSACSKTKRRG